MGAWAPKTSPINKSIQTLKHNRYPPIWKWAGTHRQDCWKGVVGHSTAHLQQSAEKAAPESDLNLAAPSAADGERLSDGLPLFGWRSTHRWARLALRRLPSSWCNSQRPRCLGGVGPERADIVGGRRHFPEKVSFFRSLAVAQARGIGGRVGAALFLTLLDVVFAGIALCHRF